MKPEEMIEEFLCPGCVSDGGGAKCLGKTILSWKKKNMAHQMT